MSRQCSPCTACCEGWLRAKIQGHQMKPGTPCLHCRDTGCAIYENRPDNPCRLFECAWVAEGSSLPERFRPDQCGAIILTDRPFQGRKVTRAIPTGEKIPDETLDWLMEQTRKTSVPLIFTENLVKDGEFRGGRIRGYGPRWFIKAVQTRLKPEDAIQLAPPS